MALKVLFFVLWIPASIVAALVVFRLSKQETKTVSVALLAAAIALAGLVVYPRTLKDTIDATRRYEQLRSTNTTRAGGPLDCLTSNFESCVNDRAWAELRRLIPKQDNFYLDTSYLLVRYWTFTSLLPRIATDDPHRAKWVVWYRADPTKLGVRLGAHHLIRDVYADGRYAISAAKVDG